MHDHQSLAVIPSVKVETVPEQVFPFLASKARCGKTWIPSKTKWHRRKRSKVEAGSATVASARRIGGLSALAAARRVAAQQSAFDLSSLEIDGPAARPREL